MSWLCGLRSRYENSQLARVSPRRFPGGRGAGSSTPRLRAVFETLEPRQMLSLGPVITELMASNASTPDGDGGTADWIEIHNPTGSPIELAGYYLTDKADPDAWTDWQFPADTPALAPGEYRLVFASGKDDSLYPYYDGGGNLHTNFKLSSGGENVALIAPDGQTVASAYWDYPGQVTDVSYGVTGELSLPDVLVPSGAAVRYHVPTAGEDLLAWTTPAYDDASWVDTIPVGGVGLVITEIDAGDADALEIQNATDHSIDTSGWFVVANDAASGNVGDVHAAVWNLPGSIGAGEILDVREGTGPGQWGSQLNWTPEQGWVMIVDDGGSVVDFAAWGYDAPEIASVVIHPGDLTGVVLGGDVIVGNQWSGAGAPAGSMGGGPPSSRFVAFNDHIRGAGTHANATTYATNGTASGLLKDIATGEFTSVTLTTSQHRIRLAGSQGNPAPGTDAYDTFHGFVDFGSATGASIELNSNDDYTHTFTGLDTGDAITYNFAGTAVRGNSRYDNRWTLVTLSGVDSATAAHTAGNGVVVVNDRQVAVWTGHNSAAGQGYVARWTDIDPGPDGEFSIISKQYRGATPGVGSGTADGSKGYGITGIRLEEVAPAGAFSLLRRAGSADGDTADDFLWSATSNLGEQNPELTLPFVTTAPAVTGVGFSDGDPSFDANIQTDVAGAMQGVNASLWSRIEFPVVDGAPYDGMTLRMKYDDGFTAYLNGQEVARRNAGNPPAYNAAASAEHDDAQAVVFEEIDISDSLGYLQTGTNVLAIGGLNFDAADADFLLLPELVASRDPAAPQYMATPTPRAANVAGALGLVADTKFSVDRGFYDAPQQVEITTATPGARIRYTTDGTVPTDSNGIDYVDGQPILVDSTTTLRAMARKDGYIYSNVDTQTYLFLDDVIVQDGAGLPDTWGYSGGNIKSPPGPDYAMDPAVVAANAATIRDDLKSVPTVSLVTDIDNWFGTGGQGIYVSGVGSPRPVSVEYFTGDGAEQFQLDGSVEIQGGGYGGTSANRWKSYKLSMQLKFKGIYGDPQLRYPLFGEDATDRFDTLILDAQLNHTWVHPSSGQRVTAKYIQDQAVADMQNAMSGGGPHGRFVHLYLNGVYWGMYTLHERPDEHFAAAYYGGVEEDYDVLKHSMNNVANGSNASYQELLNRVRANMTNAANYRRVLEMLDVDDFIDYMLANFYAGNADWAHKNWYASYNKVDPEGRWRFHSWDAEHVLEGVTENVTGKNNTAGPTEIHQRLKANPEYRLRFADRMHKHMYNDGVLTPAGAAALYQARMSEADRAIVGESARWGDNRRTGNAYTRANWLSTQNGMLAGYFPNRTGNVLGFLSDLYPAVDAPIFKINGSNRHGGEITAGDVLTMTNPNGSGTIYYTLDGTDPRQFGGATSPSAVAYGGAVTLTDSTPVKARVLRFGQWSALSDAIYHTAVPPTLAITEINYHPYDPTPEEEAAGFTDPRDFEFIELENTGPAPVSLVTVHFARGIDFGFAGSGVTSLAAGEHVVVARNIDAFQQRYGGGAPVVGDYDSLLDDGGERIALAHGADTVFLDFRYNDAGAWPGRADGRGATLELIDPAGTPAADYGDGHRWRSSTEFGGSPGRDGVGPIVDVLVNEVLTHTDPPQVDTIELYNTTGGAIDIGNWYVSDSSADYRKFRIPTSTIIDAHDYLVFDESDFNTGPTGFALDGAHGDDVWLMRGDASGRLTQFADHVEFGGALNGESFGRWPNGAGDLYPMIAPTLDDATGHANIGPRVGPDLIISEVHYNSKETLGADDLEFVEIHNPTASPVALTGWRLRKGVDYDFADGRTLSPGGTLVVLSFDPDKPENAGRAAAFRSFHQIGPAVTLVGGYGGKLDNGGDKVQLQRPDQPPTDEPDFTPHVIADEVVYDDQPPWPAEPDQTGASLHRTAAYLWGNDAASWIAADPTPGSATLIADAAPPTVTEVIVNGRPGQSVGSVDIGDGGIRTIEVVFSEPVYFRSSDVRLQTVAFPGGGEQIGGALSPESVLGSGSDTMTVTLDGAAVGTWLKVTLDAGGTLTDVARRPLDGEAPAGGSGRGYLYDPVVDLPSGDGAAGGDAVFFVGSLPGEVSGDRRVDDGDLNLLLSAMGSTSPEADFSGDGLVDAADLTILLSRLGQSLDELPAAMPLLGPIAVADELAPAQWNAPAAFDRDAIADFAPRADVPRPAGPRVFAPTARRRILRPLRRQMEAATTRHAAVDAVFARGHYELVGDPLRDHSQVPRRRRAGRLWDDALVSIVEPARDAGWASMGKMPMAPSATTGGAATAGG